MSHSLVKISEISAKNTGSQTTPIKIWQNPHECGIIMMLSLDENANIHEYHCIYSVHEKACFEQAILRRSTNSMDSYIMRLG
jgi:hypothetical protein